MNLPPAILGPVDSAAVFFLGHPVLCVILFLVAILLLFRLARKIVAVAVTVAVIGMAALVGWKWMQREGVKPPKVLQEIKDRISVDSLKAIIPSVK